MLVCSTLVLSGCAISPNFVRGGEPPSPHWQGRLSIQVQSNPVQAFSASFDLQGNIQSGSLTLSTALGSTLARMVWDKGTASLQANGMAQQFDSLDALVQHATGTDLPIASLFSWLNGVASDAPGWKADLNDLPNGRLNAQRLEPYTPANLKVILDR